MFSRSLGALAGAFAVLTAGLRPQSVRILLLAVAALITVGLSLIFQSGLRTFEEQTAAFAWRLNPDTIPEERISIVAIDEKSIEQLGPWPWSRETMARLSEALSAAGVQLQMYDIVFPEAREGDEAFVAALRNTNAVISQVPVLGDGDDVRTGAMSHSLNGLSCTPGANVGTSFRANAPAFADIPKGHITSHVANDGAVREVPAYICVDGAAYPALGLSAFLTLTGSDNWEAEVQDGRSLLDPAQTISFPAYPGINIPLDSSGNLRVSFRNAPEAYSAFPAIDVINGEIPRELLENTWVIVGYTAFGLIDIVPTPYSGAAPGVELQARILGSLLDDEVPYTPRGAPLFRALLGLMFAGVLLWLAAVRERVSGYGLAICGVALPLVALASHAVLLKSMNLWLGWLSPALYGVCAAVILILHEYARVRLERGRVLDNLSSYLPSDVAQEIAYTLPNSSISARRQNVTLLSADLRNFSAYGEARPPEEAAALLHYFFVRTTAIIEKHQGRVHEFKGDSLLALWDGSDETAAVLALRAALEMQQTIPDVLPQSPPSGLEPLALGIGIEQGPVLIGSIGPAQRRAYALLGETVTIALRIQELTAELACPVLVGECAARHLSDHNLQSQGSYLLNGLRIPHTLFAPQSCDLAPTSRDKPLLRVLLGGRQ
jgi:adenylate cyclase